MSVAEKSILFTPHNIGPISIANRFIASSISYRDADQYGFPSDSEKDHILRLARGRVGLIVPGFMFTSKNGRTRIYQNGMSSSCHADAWKDIIKQVHESGTKVMFQISHGGIMSSQETIKTTPKGPSAIIQGTAELTIPEIEEIKKTYIKAAQHCIEAGADGVQIQCGHGFLLSQFLSPLLNKRRDPYGGSIINRARIVKEIVEGIKKLGASNFAITTKINADDCVKGGVTPEICMQTVSLLHKAGVDMFEISSGLLSPWNTVRGEKKNDFDDPNRPLYAHLTHLANETPFTEGYNVESAAYIKKMNPEATISVVGGNKTFEKMEKIIAENQADFVSLGRPLLKDPFLIERFYEGKITESDCDNCNICYANPPYMSVHCPKSKVIPLVQ